MLTSIQIKRFRGLNDVEIQPLKRVNLITGKNDTGKTSVLEALRILLGKGGPSRCNTLPTEFRGGMGSGDWNENFWKWLFYNKDTQAKCEIHATNGGNQRFGVLLAFGPEPRKEDFSDDLDGLYPHGSIGQIHFFIHGNFPESKLTAEIFSSRPSDPNKDAKDYNRVILKRGKKKVEALLKIVEPRVQAVEPIHVGDNQSPLIFVDVGLSEMIPVRNMGQGFNRLLNIYSEVIAGEVNILLIDEIENGLHYSVLPLVWEGLFNAVKELDIQIFATTHSWECIEAADAAARKFPTYDLNLIRLDRVNDDIKATIIDENALETAKELNWEMR